ncbi:MAG: GntR family transcriptional regulator [bacterium]|nr:GntR family transcriptional regulator [bacterium]
MEPIERLPLREQIYRSILESIVSGDYPPGSKVKDTEVAERLDVSRTPVREVLLRLEQEGFLVGRVGRGFAVRPLAGAELREIYPILVSMESLALRTSPPLSQDLLDELLTLNGEIGAETQQALKRLEIDVIWHRKLVEGCGNKRLLALIAQLKSLVGRYLHAYILLRPNIAPSVNDHDLIVDLLRAGDVEKAVSQLEIHWRRNLSVLLEIFEV